MKRVEKIIYKKYRPSIHKVLVIYLFMFLFAPPLVKGINLGIIVAMLSALYLLRHFRSVLTIFWDSQMKIWVIGELFYLIHMLLFASLYYSLGKGTNIDNYIVNIYQVFMIIPVTMIGVLTILHYCKRNYIDFDNLLQHFILAGLIQGGMAIGAFFSSDIKHFFLTIMANNTGDEILTRSYVTNMRFFGFANSMLDAFGVGTGMLAALPFYIRLCDRKKYLFCVPALAVVPLLNSRTGLLVFCIGVFVSFLKRVYGRKEIFRILKTIPLIILLTVVLLNILKDCYPQTYQWIIADFMSFFSDDFRNKYSTATVLFSENFWKLPKFPDIILGTGHTVYSADGFAHSDVGYINKIWNVGIVGTIFQYGIYGFYFYRAGQRKITSKQRSLLAFFVIVFFMYEIKGNMLTFTPGLTIMMTFVFYIISNKYM